MAKRYRARAKPGLMPILLMHCSFMVSERQKAIANVLAILQLTAEISQGVILCINDKKCVTCSSDGLTKQKLRLLTVLENRLMEP